MTSELVERDDPEVLDPDLRAELDYYAKVDEETYDRYYKEEL